MTSNSRQKPTRYKDDFMEERSKPQAITQIIFAKSMYKQTHHYHNYPDFCYIQYNYMNTQYFTFALVLHIEAFKILQQSTLHINNEIKHDHGGKERNKRERIE